MLSLLLLLFLVVVVFVCLLFLGVGMCLRLGKQKGSNVVMGRTVLLWN